MAKGSVERTNKQTSINCLTEAGMEAFQVTQHSEAQSVIPAWPAKRILGQPGLTMKPCLKAKQKEKKRNCPTEEGKVNNKRKRRKKMNRTLSSE